MFNFHVCYFHKSHIPWPKACRFVGDLHKVELNYKWSSQQIKWSNDRPKRNTVICILLYRRYYPALRTLEQLELTCLPRAGQYRFCSIMADNIPKLRTHIRDTAMTQLRDFLESIRKHSDKIGETAIKQVYKHTRTYKHAYLWTSWTTGWTHPFFASLNSCSAFKIDHLVCETGYLEQIVILPSCLRFVNDRTVLLASLTALIPQ